MEKTISQEERMRRAQEIYNRRRTGNINRTRVPVGSVNNKIQLSLFKKMLLQLAICSIIYVIFYLIKNTGYFFSEDVLNKTKEMLSYDINFSNVYTQINTFIENNKDKFMIPPQGEENQEHNETTNQIAEENKVDDDKNKKQETNIVNENKQESGGIGGAEVNQVVEEANQDTQKTQMEIDADYIKENYKFKVPVKRNCYFTIWNERGKRNCIS